MIRLRQHRHELSPMLRMCAAVSLLFWLAAFSFCSTECLAQHSDSDHVTQATTAPDHHDSDSDHHDHDDSFCVSLRSFAPASTVCELTKPNFALAFAINFPSLSHLVSVVEPEVPISRQPPDRAWLSTPEVCLGPALHSLAPPISSLT